MVLDVTLVRLPTPPGQLCPIPKANVHPVPQLPPPTVNVTVAPLFTLIVPL